jgi:hypothetical protein
MFATPRSVAELRADSTIFSEMSVATTSPLGPTRSAAMNAATPVPVATSSTRSPGRGAANASVRLEQALSTGTQ